MNNKTRSFIYRAMVYVSAIFTAAMLVIIVGSILYNGIPYLTPSLFAWQYNSENVSLMPALLNTISMTVLSLIFAVPLGVGTAIYLSEYARRGNFFVKVVRTTADTLAGIPSIVYGLFGLLFFVTFCKLGISLIAGALTLSMMILPTIMRTAEEAMLAVPDSYREGSFGLGAGQLRTVFKIILPTAVPGILAGIVLSIGRIVGETAALIYTSGTVAQFATKLGSSARTLAIHLYALSSEGLYMQQTYATAVVLLIIVGIIYGLSFYIAGRLTHGKV